jgi:hypothetical protein
VSSVNLRVQGSRRQAVEEGPDGGPGTGCQLGTAT